MEAGQLSLTRKTVKGGYKMSDRACEVDADALTTVHNMQYTHVPQCNKSNSELKALSTFVAHYLDQLCAGKPCILVHTTNRSFRCMHTDRADPGLEQVRSCTDIGHCARSMTQPLILELLATPT